MPSPNEEAEELATSLSERIVDISAILRADLSRYNSDLQMKKKNEERRKGKKKPTRDSNARSPWDRRDDIPGDKIQGTLVSRAFEFQREITEGIDRIRVLEDNVTGRQRHTRFGLADNMETRGLNGVLGGVHYNVIIWRPNVARRRPWALCSRPYSDWLWLSNQLSHRTILRSMQTIQCPESYYDPPTLPYIFRYSPNAREKRQAALKKFLTGFFRKTSPFASLRFELFFFTQLPVAQIETELDKVNYIGSGDQFTYSLTVTEKTLLEYYVRQHHFTWVNDDCEKHFEIYAYNSVTVPDDAVFPGLHTNLPCIPPRIDVTKLDPDELRKKRMFNLYEYMVERVMLNLPIELNRLHPSASAPVIAIDESHQPAEPAPQLPSASLPAKEADWEKLRLDTKKKNKQIRRRNRKDSKKEKSKKLEVIAEESVAMIRAEELADSSEVITITTSTDNSQTSSERPIEEYDQRGASV